MDYVVSEAKEEQEEKEKKNQSILYSKNKIKYELKIRTKSTIMTRKWSA